MISPENGRARLPLVAQIVHNKFGSTECACCNKKPRIAIYVVETDHFGLYCFSETTLCLRCLKKGSKHLATGRYGLLYPGYPIVDNWSRCKKTCSHCRYTPYFDPNKSIVRFGEDHYEYDYLDLCKGCVDYMIELLKIAYVEGL